MKLILIFILTLNLLFAQTNRITTADGITCENTSDDPYEFESYIETTKDDTNNNTNNSFDDTNNNKAIFGIKLTYKFGNKKALDCNRLYQLELRQKEAKVKELEEKIKALKQASKINWDKINE